MRCTALAAFTRIDSGTSMTYWLSCNAFSVSSSVIWFICGQRTLQSRSISFSGLAATILSPIEHSVKSKYRPIEVCSTYLVIARETGKHIIFPTYKNGNGTDIDFQMIGWHGKCEVHEKFTIEDIENVRRQFPDVIILAHPECSPEVVEAADFSGSTSAACIQTFDSIETLSYTPKRDGRRIHN